MKSFNRTISFVCVVLLICDFVIFGDTTTCKPLSTFKVDCNTCTCLASGRQYSCTEMYCHPRDPNEFHMETNENGHVILRPKAIKMKDIDQDYILTRKKTTDNE